MQTKIDMKVTYRIFAVVADDKLKEGFRGEYGQYYSFFRHSLERIEWPNLDSGLLNFNGDHETHQEAMNEIERCKEVLSQYSVLTILPIIKLD
jgi:hypothetical protein